MYKFAPSIVVAGIAAALMGCQDNGPQKEKVTIEKNPYPSTYKPVPSQSTLITNATVLTGTGEKIEQGDVFIVDGKIKQVGKDLSVPADITIDAEGKWVTPGIIDVHSHLGAYPSPSVESHSDGNEMINLILLKYGLSILYGRKIQALTELEKGDHHATNLTWLCKPIWWSWCYLKECAGTNNASNEIPRCAIWVKDGMW